MGAKSEQIDLPKSLHINLSSEREALSFAEWASEHDLTYTALGSQVLVTARPMD